MSPPSPAVLAEVLVATVLLAFGAVLWRRALVMSLPFLVILDGLAVPVAGSSIRVGQLVAGLLVVPLGASTLIGARRLRTDRATWWLAAILAVNLVASALNSPTLSYSLLQCASLASVWIIYVLLINFLDTREELEAFFHRVLWAALVASAIGIGAFLLAVAGMPVGGAEVSADAAERFTNAYGAYGTMVEPNIFGSFSAAHLVLAMVLLTVGAQSPAAATHPRLVRWVAAGAAVGLVLSFTRAAWLGALAGMVCFVVLGGRILRVHVRPWRPLGVGLAVMVAPLLLPGQAGAVFRFKLVNLVNLASQTVVSRLVTYSVALQQTVEHPFIGWGTFTFAPLAAQGSDFRQFDNWRNLWIGNYLLLAVHDTGVVGLVLWCGLLWSILAPGIRAARALRIPDPVAASRSLALTVAVACLLVAFLTTSGFSLGYPWLLIGLLGAYCRLAAEDRGALAARTMPSPTLAALPADAT